MFDYSYKKYGDALNATRFFETKEIKNSNGSILLEKGKVDGVIGKSLAPPVTDALFHFNSKLGEAV